ncbi:hypothetical protein GCK32_018341, partial [Trichostrongylus colubriformis]
MGASVTGDKSARLCWTEESPNRFQDRRLRLGWAKLDVVHQISGGRRESGSVPTGQTALPGAQIHMGDCGPGKAREFSLNTSMT